MTKQEAKEALDRLNATIALAAGMIEGEQETLARFFAEQRDFDTIAPILDSTRWNSTERRVVEALLTPIYKAAQDFLTAYSTGKMRAEEALAKVSDRHSPGAGDDGTARAHR